MTAYILIVEDQVEKKNLVEKVVSLEIECNIEWSQTITSAFSVINANPDLDLVLLDMAFSSSAGLKKTHANAVAGIEFLQNLETYGLSIPVIVVTSYDSFTNGQDLEFGSIAELDESLAEFFPSNYRGVVRTRHDSDDWHKKLIDLLKESLDQA